VPAWAGGTFHPPIQDAHLNGQKNQDLVLGSRPRRDKVNIVNLTSSHHTRFHEAWA
jgi:hypothetical protein